MKERPLTTAEAAQFLSINIWTLREYIRDGILKAHKMGDNTGKRGSKRRWLIWKHDLVDFVNRHSNTQEA